MKIIFGFLLAIFVQISYSQENQNRVALIPEPVSIKFTSGQFILPQQVKIEAPAQEQFKQSAQLLKEKIAKASGRNVSIQSSAEGAVIRLIANKTADPALGQEGYSLRINSKEIVLKANSPAGLFYGVQTLLQLFPKEIESNTVQMNTRWELPALEILDYPRFGWRGLMFDVSRHFFTKDEVKKFIDDMVRYKYNLLHLHLTDDEGWRIEIKGLPKLTEVGAWRVDKTGYFGTFSPPAKDEPNSYGGFYTQEDLADLIKYAKERFVDILPEIDVPGHSLAAVVAYPELACTEGAENYRVRSGEPIKDWSKGKPPIALIDDNLCPANENVYVFMDTVISQIARLFPFEYIHIGGDECSKNFWEKSKAVKNLMKKEGLKDMNEVQSYFTRRMEKIVTAKGKKMIGWDEIMEGGLPASAAVMSWQGMKGGIEAAKMGHEVVMSPTTFAYLDYMQADPIIEPRVYASLRLKTAYQFEPLPDGVDAKLIKGGQANIWTEQMYNMRTVQYMIWPRALAISESLWSQKEKKSWNYFFSKVEKHFDRFDMAEIKYSRAAYDPIFEVKRNADNQVQVALSTEVEGLDIYYSFDNSFPDHFYPKYTAPLIPPKDAVQLKLITYRGKTPVGRMIVMPVEELQKRAGKSR